MSELSYEERQKQLELARKAKHAELTKLVAQIDSLIERALESKAYHSGDVDALNKARTSVFAVRAGTTRRVQR